MTLKRDFEKERKEQNRNGMKQHDHESSTRNGPISELRKDSTGNKMYNSEYSNNTKSREILEIWHEMTRSRDEIKGKFGESFEDRRCQSSDLGLQRQCHLTNFQTTL
jgi:hypothetical protein